LIGSRSNYSSFSRYFHRFLILKLIERTDKKEPAIYDFLEKRVFYRLTDKGKSEVEALGKPKLPFFYALAPLGTRIFEGY